MIHLLKNAAMPDDLYGFNRPHWFAVQTRSRFEKVVRDELTFKGIEHYLPTIEQTHQWKDRQKSVEIPLFSGYIFARCQDRESDRLRVLRSNGVVRILGSGGASHPVPDCEIDSIRQLLLSGNGCFPHPFIQEGAWVRVRRGVLAGVEGRLVRVKSKTRLVVSVELLSQSVATEVDARDIEAAPERGTKCAFSAGRIH